MLAIRLSALILSLLLCCANLLAAHKAEVVLNSHVLFEVGSTDVLDASERAALISSRLQSLLTSETLPQIQVREAHGNWEIYAGETLIVTVTDKDGSSFQTSARKLAQRWADAIESALYLIREERKEPIRIDGVEIFRVGGTEAASAAERATIINGRLKELVGRADVDPVVRVERREKLHVITVGGEVLLTVTENDALSNRTSVKELAQQWAELLGKAIKRARQQRTREYQVYALKKALAALALLIISAWALIKLSRFLVARLEAIRKRRREQAKMELRSLEAAQMLIRWLAWLGSLALVGIFAYYALSLLPQTREYLGAFTSIAGRVADKLIAGFTAKLFTIGNNEISLKTLLQIALFILIVVWIARSVRRFLLEMILAQTDIEKGLQHAIATGTGYLIILIGFLIGLQVVGIDLSALAVIAGAVGIGIGFGLQNIVNNFISGLIILVERPIQIGDRVQVGDILGDVVKISARSTTILTNDNIAIIVPNSNFISDTVINWSHHGDRKVRFHIKAPVSYKSDVRLVEKALLEAADEHPDVLKYPPPAVRFMSFDDSCLMFELRVWTTRLIHRQGQITSDLNFLIFDKFKKYGIEIPYPQRDLHLRSAVPIEARIEQTRLVISEDEEVVKK